MKITGYDDPSYCGYSNGNTGWRLATAIVTLLFSVCIFLKIFDERPALLTSLYWALYSCWFLAAGLDVVAVANGQASCKDSFDAINGTATCDNSVYGITIAIDVAICIVIGIFVYFQVRGGGVGGASSGTKMSNAV